MKGPLKCLAALLPFGFAGVVAGHFFVYRLLFGEAAHRHANAPAGGHGYFTAATALAAVFLLLALAWYAWLGYNEKSLRRSPRQISFLKATLLLFLLQGLLFIGMEVAEQAALNQKFWMDFALSPLLPMGLIFQFITAAFLTLLMSGVRVIGSKLAKSKHIVSMIHLQTWVVASGHISIFPGFRQTSRSPPVSNSII